MRSLSSRIRIALLSAGLSGLVLMGFGLFAWVTFYHGRIAAVDREIKSLATRHPGLFMGRGSYERLASSLEFTFGEDHTNRVILLLTDTSNRILYQSPHWPAGIQLSEVLPAVASQSQDRSSPSSDVSADLPQPAEPWAGGPGRGRGFGRGGGPPPGIVFSIPPEFRTLSDGLSSWRIGAFKSEEMNLMLGLNLHDAESEMAAMRNALLVSVPVALGLIGLGGWVIAGRALRPLNTIAATAELVTAQGLDRRIPESSESPEMQRVVSILNRMMDRLEASFRQATRFSADASHELKTPIAVMQAELEVAMQNAVPGSPQQALCVSLMENVQRLKTVTRSLLLLAQSDAGQLKLVKEPVNLKQELEDLVEDARVLAAEKPLIFETLLEDSISAKLDLPLFRTAVFNLLSNAVKYSQTGGTVEVALKREERRARITVSNTGPQIPSGERFKIFDRFYRVHSSGAPATEGLGLGLSLAREIARAHHGDVVLLENRPGWTCFELSFGFEKE